MPQYAIADDVFRALADSTRRKVLERLASGPATVSELAEPFDMKLPSFVQHLGVLERSRLIQTKKTGRTRTVQLVPGGLQAVEEWLARQRRVWEARFNQLDEYLQELKHSEEQP